MDECRLLVMLHRALPTRGHGCVEKQSLSVHPSVSLDASSIKLPRVAHWCSTSDYTLQIISAIAEKLLARGIGAMRPRLLLTSCPTPSQARAARRRPMQ